MCHAIERKYADKQIRLLNIVLLPSTLQDVVTFLTCSSIKNWKRVNMSYCHIQDYGLQVLYSGLKGSGVTIEHFDLFNNDLSSSSDSFLSEITIFCKVKALIISCNKNVGETENFIGTVLSHPETVIERLYMNNNCYRSNEWAKLLFASLRKNKSLKRLELFGNTINDEISVVIGEVLCVSSTLKIIYINDNPITGEASQYIVTCLQDNDVLETLRLPNYPEEIALSIQSLQDIVNQKRKSRGCDVTLEIMYGWSSEVIVH